LVGITKICGAIKRLAREAKLEQILFRYFQQNFAEKNLGCSCQVKFVTYLGDIFVRAM
jgi:hypothetical protein